MNPEPGTRCGFVAVIGPPNSGKSTLVNELVGTKVTIVSPKAQTTRSRVLGIALRGGSQVVLLDTPGIFSAGKRLERAMVSAAWNGAREADMSMLVLDASRAGNRNYLAGLPDDLTEYGKSWILVLNKTDIVAKPDLLQLSQRLNELHDFEATFMISALKSQGTDKLADFLAGAVREGPWLYDADSVTDMPDRLMAAEITREKIFLQLHQELPYGIAVQTDLWEEEEGGGRIRIGQTIFVSRDSHKGMVLGRGGSRIGKIGEAARLELNEILGKRVRLDLHVKVKENWREDAEHFASLGLEYNS